MAITIDWLTYVINVPKADLTLLQASPELRELDLDWFRLQLKDIEDDEPGIPQPDTHIHLTEVTLAGLTYARIVEILDPYTVEFEDGQYTVACVGANHNVSDVKVPNQVSLIVNNAAGLITNAAIEFSSFNGGVTVDETSSYSGTVFPVGTPQRPVNNLDDAKLIAVTRGFTTFFVLGDLTVGAALVLDGYEFVGDGMDRSTITLNAAASVENCTYREATIAGTLDGSSRLIGCLIEDLIYVKGFIEQCVLGLGTITLGGADTAHFLDCWSGVVGTGTPTIDLGGSGQELGIRNYNGGIKLTNKSGAEDVSIDLNSGHVELDATVTNGDIVIRGLGKLTDNSVGANVLADDLINAENLGTQIWEYTRP